MKFKIYLNESDGNEITSIEEFNDLLHSKCKQYLKLIKPFKRPFKRGMNLTYNMGWKPVRQDRLPRGTNRLIFPEFNKWLVKNGHNDRSKSVSVTSGEPEMFGNKYYIFIIGSFSYTWIDSKDVNMSDLTTGWRTYGLNHYNFQDNEMREPKYELDKSFRNYFHTNKGIDIAYKNRYEVWFNATRYLFINDRDYFWNKSKQIMVKFNEI